MSFKPAKLGEPIDVVITWVDSSDPGFQSIYDSYRSNSPKSKGSTDKPERHRENGELLYVLRSIEKFIPWIRNIYIVTNGQKPDFINFESPKIHLVSHNDIFDDNGKLPCFNSFVIDSYVHNIPGLSEWFLRFDDDFFVGKPVSQKTIFGNNGFGVHYFQDRVKPKSRVSTVWDRHKSHNASLVSSTLGTEAHFSFAHMPQLRSKTITGNVINTFSEPFAQTRQRNLRDEKDAILYFLYPYFVISRILKPSFLNQAIWNKLYLVLSRDVRLAKYSNKYKSIQLGKSDWVGELKAIHKKKPAFFNLNDAFGPNRKEESLDVLVEWFNNYYPDQTPFEV